VFEPSQDCSEALPVNMLDTVSAIDEASDVADLTGCFAVLFKHLNNGMTGRRMYDANRNFNDLLLLPYFLSLLLVMSWCA